MREKCLLIALFGLFVVGMLAGPGYAEIAPETCVGIWLLDEGSGKLAEDSSGDGHHGELMKEAKWVDGKFGKAVEFDGVDDRIDCGDIDALDFGAGDFTLCVWIKAANTSAGEAGNGWSRILDKHYTSGFCLMRNAGGANVQLEVGGNAQKTISTSPAFDDTWHHVAAVRYDDTKARIYIDGKLDAEGSLVGGNQSNDNHFCMAYDNLGLGGNMKCSLDEVAIFNVAVEEEDIRSIMTSGLEKALGIMAVSSAGKLANTWAGIKAGD